MNHVLQYKYKEKSKMKKESLTSQVDRCTISVLPPFETDVNGYKLPERGSQRKSNISEYVEVISEVYDWYKTILRVKIKAITNTIGHEEKQVAITKVYQEMVAFKREVSLSGYGKVTLVCGDWSFTTVEGSKIPNITFFIKREEDGEYVFYTTIGMDQKTNELVVLVAPWAGYSRDRNLVKVVQPKE